MRTAPIQRREAAGTALTGWQSIAAIPSRHPCCIAQPHFLIDVPSSETFPNLQRVSAFIVSDTATSWKAKEIPGLPKNLNAIGIKEIEGVEKYILNGICI